MLFDMTNMDCSGFRRLRTICQLSFETIPQIFLQTRILVYMIHNPKDPLNELVFMQINYSNYDDLIAPVDEYYVFTAINTKGKEK